LFPVFFIGKTERKTNLKEVVLLKKKIDIANKDGKWKEPSSGLTTIGELTDLWRKNKKPIPLLWSWLSLDTT